MLVKDKSFLRKKKRQYGHDTYKNSQEYEKQKLLKYRKNVSNEKKCLIIIIKKYFYFQNLFFSQRWAR